MFADIARRTAVASLALGALFLAAWASNPSATTGSTGDSLPAHPVVVAIGDSIMKGHGLPASQAWPAIIGAANHWTVHNLACDGAGFKTVGAPYDCAATFDALVQKAEEMKPDIVLISGSSNDLGTRNDTLSNATVAALHSLRTENPHALIIGISTVWGDTATPPQIDDINDQVSAAVDAVRGLYLSIGQPLAHHRSWLQSDDVHPTAEGQRVLAKVISRALRSANVLT